METLKTRSVGLIECFDCMHCENLLKLCSDLLRRNVVKHFSHDKHLTKTVASRSTVKLKTPYRASS